MTGPVRACRMCGGLAFERYLDLGLQPPADQFRRPDQVRVEPVTFYPLEVVLCTQCGLSQLSYVVSPEILYQDDYPYEASTTRSGRLHFSAFADSVTTAFGLTKDDLAVDIGSNVGVLLAGFAKRNVRVLGVDPAPNIARIAEERGIPTLVHFISPDVARLIVREHGHAAVVTATNVFAHIDDLSAFAEAMQILMRADGVLVIEAPYFVNLLRDLEYDTIYHEHLSYLTVKTVASFFSRFSMDVFDVKQVDIHGGSMRIFVARSGVHEQLPMVRQMIKQEETDGVHSLPRLQAFARAVAANRDALRELVYSLRSKGARLAAVSAPAKGMTLLNYAKLGHDVFEFATEKSMLKVGRFTPGGDIPVLPDAALMERRPDYGLLLAWNFAAEIMANLRPFTEAGGRFILPIPEPRVVDNPPRG